MREIHVSKNGNDAASGDIANPFLTIQKAADVAIAGDRVIIHEGIYREWVKPRRGGKSNCNRIEYMAADQEKVVIKGSEIIKGWEREKGTVWKVRINNQLFGSYNPYLTLVYGDWFSAPKKGLIHTGDVYLNGTSFYEAHSLEEVYEPKIRETGPQFPWKEHKEQILKNEWSKYVWKAEVTSEETILYVNFHEYDPNQECVEINVRKCCFYPEQDGVNYITVKGLELTQAATKWAPPTAEQIGLIGPRWSKGWIIENNCIHDSKCVGISLGKTIFQNDEYYENKKDITGFQYQMETVFTALQQGWSKENIGSHIIRNNKIFDCGQAGIAGHLGAVFSTITDNEISYIATKHEFFGAEIAGIKLHDALDVQIIHNYIHHCTLGTWLDWEVQGTRLSRNVYRENERDLMIEVAHGPYIVDKNIFGSKYNLFNLSQGGAFIQNLFCGGTSNRLAHDRFTPYHVMHSTQVAGVIAIYGADDRFYQNMYVGGNDNEVEGYFSGLSFFDEYPASYEEFYESFGTPEPKDYHIQYKTKQPVFISENVHFNGSKASIHDKKAENGEAELWFEEKEDGLFLHITNKSSYGMMERRTITSEVLGVTRCSHATYEGENGEKLLFAQDFHQKDLTKEYLAGPFSQLKNGENSYQLWCRK